MSDDLREALNSAIEEHENEPEVETPVVEEAASEEPADSTDSEPVAEAVPTEAESDTPESPPETKAAVPPAREHRVDRAPASWKKEAKGEWAALPLHVRQEVYRREQEVNRVLQDAAPARQIAEQFNQTVQPYMARIQGFGISPHQAVGQLLQADHILATSNPTDAARYMAKLIKDYNIDFKALDDALVASIDPRAADPSTQLEQRLMAQLEQRFAPVLSFAQQQQQYQQQQAQREQQEAAASIEQMSLDPRFPYFDEVREDMADIIELGIKRGIAITPEQAYHKATMFNDDVSGTIQKQGMMSVATQQHQQAQRAKAASSSVSGAPAGGGESNFQGDGSLRGAIEAAFNGSRV